MNATEIWTMVTAIATCALALFAVLAWIASRKTLTLMRSQETVTKESAQSQVDDQVWGRQVEALATYTSVLREMADMTAPLVVNGGSRFLPNNYVIPQGLSSASDVDQIVSKVSSAGLIWRLQHARSSEPMEPLREYEQEVLFSAKATTFGTCRWSTVQTHAAILLSRASDWQRDAAERPSVISEVKGMSIRLRDERAKMLPNAESASTTADTVGGPQQW